MTEPYVIKTRNDEDEYLAYKGQDNSYFFTEKLSEAYQFSTLECARSKISLPILQESRYRVDIYKLVEVLDYVERGV